MIIATVVTFNKLNMLQECLEALLSQTFSMDKIIVVDNASTDGTKDFLQGFQNDKVHVVFSKLNLGGAGGFNLALKESMKFNPQFVWVMDDDSIVESNALEELMKANKVLKGKFGFLSSNVLWTDGSPCLMNIPKTEDVWTSYSQKGLVKIKTASFVSMFINADAIKAVGYPISEFFIWGDDVEFSDRLSDYKDSYFVPQSIVIHKMGENVPVNILTDSKNRIPRYYYDRRNRFYRFKKKGAKEILKYIANSIMLCLKVIFTKNDYKFLKLKTITKGFLSGIIFNPKVEQYKSEGNR
ncbi:glycosyltransferase family 2 protein [Enterococcus asini]|uniref:glycosyltransferase family 2 protein n=1 Tax=Enterococcus asini TaxID=57732 RepID=UPI0032E3B953